ncbi:hypothetical protein [Mycobacterium sp. Z3061]|uniref:hypothetical protein n=1 Tax=Mycobacterium sp. Z3061 TaxID=3073562 RepID=UPI002872B04B|nr:hypothetical protein [Mycobacterium sp. Z3061]
MAVVLVAVAVLRRRPVAVLRRTVVAVPVVAVPVVVVLRRRPVAVLRHTVVAPAAVVPVVVVPVVVARRRRAVVADRRRAAVDLRLHPVRAEAPADRKDKTPDRRPRSCVAVWAYPAQAQMAVSAAACAVQAASSEGHSAEQAHRRPTSVALSVALAARAQTSGADCD